MNQSSDEALRAELAQLSTLSTPELRAKWQELHGKPLKGARRDLLIRGIAYKLQANVYGGLSAELKRRLRQLRAGYARNPEFRPPARVELKPGVQLVREWRGVAHEITVLERGFVYRDETFKSLSEIARLITGAHRSGPLFFGLIEPAQSRPERPPSRRSQSQTREEGSPSRGRRPAQKGASPPANP